MKNEGAPIGLPAYEGNGQEGEAHTARAAEEEAWQGVCVLCRS